MVPLKRRMAHGKTVASRSRRLLRSAGLALIMSCAAATAKAEQPVAPAADVTAAPTAGQTTDPTITGSVERHWTNNALDSDRAVTDWYTLLRGSLDQKWGDDDAYAKVHGEFQATHYDRTSIEDDRGLAVSAEAFRRLAPGFELRGTLSYNVSSTGDDLDLGPLVIGTREFKQVFGAQAQLGIDLGHATTLILDIADSFQKINDTTFEDDLIPPTKLHADRNLFEIGARITHAVGRLGFGGSASALIATVERVGFPPLALSFVQYTARAEAAYKGADGSTYGAAFGAQLLRGEDNIYERVRPTWQFTAAKPLPKGFELRGTYFGRFETNDTDDPLASWLQRAELEIGLKLRENLSLASGVFWQAKENLLLENVERSKGVYGEATYNATKSLAVVARIDYSQTVKTIIEVHERTVDAFIGLRAKI